MDTEWGLMRAAYIFSLFLPFTSAFAGPPACRSALDAALDANHRQLTGNQSFLLRRNGLQYLAQLGTRFFYDLRTFDENSHWLDAGAGEALAMSDLSRGFIDPLGRAIRIPSRKLTALSLKKPVGFDARRLFPETGRGLDFRYLDGKYLEDFSLDEIGVCDLITDVMGPLSYSAQVDAVLKKYLQLLAVGGKLYVHYKPGSIKISGMTFEDYLRRIPGVRVDFESSAIRIEKIAWTEDRNVPDLILQEFYPGSPPTRIYIQKP